MKWIVKYSLICIGAIVGVLAFVWALNGFDTAGISTAGLVRLVLDPTVRCWLRWGSWRWSCTATAAARTSARIIRTSSSGFYDAGEPGSAPGPARLCQRLAESRKLVRAASVAKARLGTMKAFMFLPTI